MLSHFAYKFLCKFIRGNRGTSATTPFVPTPSGSRWNLPCVGASSTQIKVDIPRVIVTQRSTMDQLLDPDRYRFHPSIWSLIYTATSLVVWYGCSRRGHFRTLGSNKDRRVRYLQSTSTRRVWDKIGVIAKPAHCQPVFSWPDPRALDFNVQSSLTSRYCLGHHRKGTPGIGNVDYVLNVG